MILDEKDEILIEHLNLDYTICLTIQFVQLCNLFNYAICHQNPASHAHGHIGWCL